MITYSIDMPLTLPKDVSYRTWHDNQVESRIVAYNSTNPLGVSTSVNWMVIIYIPAMVIVAGTMNTCALYVLQSNFLRDLVVEPLLETLLYLQTFLLIVGPLYIWLVQCCGFDLSRRQLYPCFLLLWGHNFAVLASSSVLVAIIIERALSIGKPEIFWDIWQKVCRNTVKLLLAAALVLAVGGLMCIDGTIEQKRVAYPICLPWWDNEHSSVSPLWYKILAFNFSLGPSLLILLSMALLISSVIRFKKLMRSGIEALNHYSALYLEIRSTLHTKFIKSVWCLGLLFIITSSPLGCFIIFGPVYTRIITHDYIINGTATTTSRDIVTKMETNSPSKYFQMVTHSMRSPVDHNYLLVSRCDAETLLWIAYYSFTLFVVPVLLTTEVLFKREWKGQLENLSRSIRCRKNKSFHWSGFEIDGYDKQDLMGPYIAKSDQHPSSLDGVETRRRNTEKIKIYDAGKVERAGRRLEKNISDSKQSMYFSKPDASKSDYSTKKVLAEGDYVMFGTQLVTDRAMLKTLLISSSEPTAKIKQSLEMFETRKTVQN